jgi:hypothetical protein
MHTHSCIYPVSSSPCINDVIWHIVSFRWLSFRIVEDYFLTRIDSRLMLLYCMRVVRCKEVKVVVLYMCGMEK